MVSAMSPKRKLPVIQSSADEPPARPAWQWVLFATLLIFAVWVPAAYLVLRLFGTGLFQVAAHAVALGVSAAAASFVVGRWHVQARVVHGGLAGLLSVTLAAALAYRGDLLSWLVGWFAAGSVGTCAGALGAALGMRGKRRAA